MPVADFPSVCMFYKARVRAPASTRLRAAQKTLDAQSDDKLCTQHIAAALGAIRRLNLIHQRTL